jgi:divalent metal cation (Fe/Co/Zn/Cd) transporter
MSLAELRDIVVIVYGAMGVILMLALAIAAFGLWFAIRSLSRSVQALLDDPIRPTLEEVHKTVQNVRGTSEFMTDTAVHPLIRVVALGRGVRRGMASVTGIRNRRK